LHVEAIWISRPSIFGATLLVSAIQNNPEHDKKKLSQLIQDERFCSRSTSLEAVLRISPSFNVINDYFVR
jgi:hypothetical protein